MAPDSQLFLGIDAGTSGIRAVCIDGAGKPVGTQQKNVSIADRDQLKRPSLWRKSLVDVLGALSAAVDFGRIRGLCVGGQSGTVLLANEIGEPLGDRSLLYNDAPSPQSVEILSKSIGAAPQPLARGIDLYRQTTPEPVRLLHQADWIAGLFTGRFDTSDHNNALKTGYLPDKRRWAFSPGDLPANILLPRILPTGTALGTCQSTFARSVGLQDSTAVVAGTTDGMAGFVAATELSNVTPGKAVTSLGTTLVVKTISPNEIVSTEHGVYSHRLYSSWVAGGASNAGAGALLNFFTPETIAALSSEIDPGRKSPFDYYPLVTRGERFPVSDPDMLSRTSPRPADDVEFLAGLFESIARIEKRAYEVIAELGGQYPSTVMTVGGGSRNPIWTGIRKRVLGVDVFRAAHTEAAFGAAVLARQCAAQ